MAANYAFTGNPQAQSDYAHPAAPYGYQDDHEQYPTHNYGYPTAYDQPAHHDDDGHAGHPDHYTDYAHADRNDQGGYDSDEDRRHPDAMAQHNNLGSPRDYNEKALPPGGGVAGPDFYGARHRPNSIWTAQDRHVFFKRSVPVRCLRTLFCIVVWAVIIIISVVLLIVTFAKPPNVALMSVNVPDSSDFSVSGTSFKANGSVNFAVSNPNSFSATIKHLTANLYDANLADKVSIGNGTLKDQKIAAKDNTTIVFPFDVAIDLSSDATELISDVVSSCGITTRKRASGNLNVLLDIDAKIEILSVSINIPISKNVSFACPTSAIQSVVSSLLGSDSSSIISSLLGGSSRRGVDGVEDGERLLLDREVEDTTAEASHALARRLVEAAQSELNTRNVLSHLVDDWLPRSDKVHQDSL